jgi:hypothetical protein
MSFSDLMSSGRGPGVIGMVLALIVLLGFGLLFMFAFDEGWQGADQSIESVISNQAKEIDNLKSGIEHGEKELMKAPALLAAGKKLKDLQRENQFRDGNIDGLKKGIASTNEAISAKLAEMETYKDKYRAFARGKAKGRELESLETRDGNTYQKVVIREVTPIGLQIMHDGGQKRIAFELLPAGMQDEFQFDPKQKADAVAKEEAMRNVHETAVSTAQEVAGQQAAAQREKEAEEKKQNMMRAIAVKESRIESLKNEIKSLEEALPKESLKRISNAPQMKLQLSNKQRELSTLSNDVARLRSAL